MSNPVRKIFAQAALFTLCIAAAGISRAQTDKDSEIIPPKSIYKPDPSHPKYLYDRGIEGEAIVVVSVDRMGSVFDPVVEKATDEEFGISAMLAASEWTFEPATKGGVPIEVKVRIPFEFKIAFEHKLNVEMGREVFKELEFPVIPSFELDEAPMPTFVPSFDDFYPKSFVGSGKSAAISVEFIIDPNGNVINPRVISVSTHGFEESAIRAISHIKYRPISVGGQPVYVSLIMPIQLSE